MSVTLLINKRGVLIFQASVEVNQLMASGVKSGASDVKSTPLAVIPITANFMHNLAIFMHIYMFYAIIMHFYE